MYFMQSNAFQIAMYGEEAPDTNGALLEFLLRARLRFRR